MATSRTRVKICGITRLSDALCAARLGVDALGFVFVPASKRYIKPEDAAEIVASITPFVTIVGLFLDAQESEVENVLSLMPQLVPQFHGQESARFCDSFRRPYIKALGVGKSVDSTMPSMQDLQAFRLASGFLFDSNEPGALGGTGHTFDWNQLNTNAVEQKSLILAGGINAGNVVDAVNRVRPYALDVSSGVESAKGIKDVAAMQKLMEAVAMADAQSEVQLHAQTSALATAHKD